MFTKKRIVALMLATVMSMSMVLTSCTSVAANNYPGTTEAGAVTINIAQEPPKMFSTISTDTVSFNLLRHLNDGLTILDKNDKPISGVAKDWKVSDDGLVYTFNLKDTYNWTNGEKVTAKDFDFAFKALLDPTFAAPYAYFGYVFKNGQQFAEGKVKWEDVGVKVLDDYKLEITLEQPTTYILDMLAFGVFLPVNQKAYEAVGDKYATDADKIVTNGAFTMESWAHESEIVLKKNPAYPSASDVKIEKIVCKMISDTNTGMNTFKSNELDMLGLNGDQLAQMKTENQPTLTYDDGSTWYFEFNLNVPTLANEKVRKAMTYGVDTESFVKNVLKNSSTVATQFTPPSINGNKKKFSEEVGPQFKSHDVEAAKKLIEEAKKELGVDKIEVSLIIDDGDTAQKHAAYFQEAWQSTLGIKVNVEAVPFKSRLARLEAKDFEICMAGWGPDYNDPMTFLEMFETGNGNNHTSYTNPEYDALLAKVRSEANRDTRFGYLMDLEKLLMKDMPIGPYYNRVRDYTLSGKLTDVVRTAFQDFNLVNATIK